MIERREWFESQQRVLFQGLPPKSSGKSMLSSENDFINDNYLQINTDTNEISNPNKFASSFSPEINTDLNTNEQKTQSSNLSDTSSFSCLALDLGAESYESFHEVFDLDAELAKTIAKQEAAEFVSYTGTQLTKGIVELAVPQGSVRGTVFLFMGIGSNGLCMQSFSRRHLQCEGLHVLSFVIPGRLNRLDEKSIESLKGIVKHVVDIIKHVGLSNNSRFRDPDHKLMIFGHNLGALIAFELIREKKFSELFNVTSLIVSGSLPPDAQSILNKRRQTPSISTLHNNEFIDRMYDKGLLPTLYKNKRDILRLYIPNFKNDIHNQENYVYIKSAGVNAPLRCNIFSISIDDDNTVAAKDMFPWRSFTTSNYSHDVIHKGGQCYWMEPYNEMQLKSIFMDAFSSNNNSLQFKK